MVEIAIMGQPVYYIKIKGEFMEKRIRGGDIKLIQIENNTNCNYKCWFCQNRYYPTPKNKVMGMKLFELILNRVREAYPKEEANYITFSVYNEPTLDPYLIDRIRLMTEMGFNHSFVSNGSNITSEFVKFVIEEKPNILDFRINIPTINSGEAQKVMGITATYYNKVLDEIKYLLREVNKHTDIPVIIMVNGKGTLDHQNTFKEVVDYFKQFKVDLSMSGLSNRAGLLDHVVEEKIDHGRNDYLRCMMNYFNNLYFGIEGNLYLCCNDYYQEYSYGNVKDMPIKDMLKSDKRKEIIAKFMADYCRYCNLAT